MNKLALLSYVARTAFVSTFVHGEVIDEAAVQRTMSLDSQIGTLSEIRDTLDTLYQLGLLAPVKVDAVTATYKALA